eukprot:8359658-Pyramimonas_sp.AAC.1
MALLPACPALGPLGQLSEGQSTASGSMFSFCRAMSFLEPSLVSISYFDLDLPGAVEELAIHLELSFFPERAGAQ